MADEVDAAREQLGNERGIDLEVHTLDQQSGAEARAVGITSVQRSASGRCSSHAA